MTAVPAGLHAQRRREWPLCPASPLPPGYDGGPCRYVEPVGDDALAPARGIGFGVLLVVPVWALLLGLAWLGSQSW